MADNLLARLKYGSAPWNMWRRDHPDVAAILTRANLREADLLGADLTDTQYSAEDLTGALHGPHGPTPSSRLR